MESSSTTRMVGNTLHGFPLTINDYITYAALLANEAHAM